MTELKPRPFCVGNARKDAEALREILVDDCVDFPHVVHTMLHKAACLIEFLSEELEHVKRERDAAVEDISRECHKCKHFKVLFNGCTPDYDCDHSDVCEDNDHWQWRGVKEEKDE